MPRWGWVFGASLAAPLLATLFGCGVIYTSPEVNESGMFERRPGGLAVDVVPMTYESTVAANLVPNVPSRLPFSFQPGATDHLQTSVVVPRLGQLPVPPSRPGVRPGNIPTRLPPIEPPEPYRIGVADVLLLSVNAANAQLEDLPGLISAQAKRQGFIVQDDGAIAIPDAGRVRVAGMTLQDAEAAIFQALVSAGIDPSFSLEIAEFNSQRIAIGGEVRQPILVPITLKPLHLHEAISSAGGLALPSNEYGRIVLTRGDEVYQVGLDRYINDPSIRDIVLRDGDTIFVESEFREERARNRFAEELQLISERTLNLSRIGDLEAQARQLALSQLTSEREAFKDRLELGAVDRGYAYLAGEVPLPIRVPLPFENSAVLADVLFSDKARGINVNFGDYGEIYVLRRPTNPEEAASVLAYHLDAENAVALSLASMFEMRDGDIVFVAEQPVTAWNRALSQSLPTLLPGLINSANAF